MIVNCNYIWPLLLTDLLLLWSMVVDCFHQSILIITAECIACGRFIHLSNDITVKLGTHYQGPNIRPVGARVQQPYTPGFKIPSHRMRYVAVPCSAARHRNATQGSACGNASSVNASSYGARRRRTAPHRVNGPLRCK